MNPPPDNPDSPLLNQYTTAVLQWAALVTPPEGWVLTVAADSDLILRSETGKWVGLRMYRIDNPQWELTRGSPPADMNFGRRWDSLTEAVDAIVAAYQPPPPKVVMAHTLESLSTGEATARAISVITANLDAPDFTATINLYKQIFEECDTGEILAFFAVLGGISATTVRLLGKQLDMDPSTILQGIALGAIPTQD